MTQPYRLLLVALVLVAGTASAGLPTVTHEGRSYVELTKLAEAVRGRLEAPADGPNAYLRTPTIVVTFTRNWQRVLVNGAPIVLDSPVRVRKGVWLVPQVFEQTVMPKLIASAAPAAASPADKTERKPAPPPELRPEPVMLEELRYRSYPSFTRIVLEATGPVVHRVDSNGGKETRVRILALSGEPAVHEINDGFIDEARLERAGRDALLRVTFEGAPGEVRASTLADPPRLVLDFMRPAEPTPKGGTLTPLRTIVLDAGHGGHDPGAVGPGGLMEKDLVLDVTRRVAKLVRDRLDVKVQFSRDGDHFVTLRDRTSFANRERADLFVSIHANAHREAWSSGVETYFLSSEATDNAARQVAALENAVVQLEKPAGAGARAGTRMDTVKQILWDLAQSEFQLESSRLAEVVQDSMTQALRMPNRGVKQAGFYVLGGAAMPAILVEIGFVTNPREERRLKDSRYRDEVAQAIYAGLAAYKRHWDQRARAVAEKAK
ncbi:MAG: N-acetylmuramoyl-L-alanine amidase family protein [Candidatus Rokuibacteriota bacterium]